MTPELYGLIKTLPFVGAASLPLFAVLAIDHLSFGARLRLGRAIRTLEGRIGWAIAGARYEVKELWGRWLRARTQSTQMLQGMEGNRPHMSPGLKESV